MNVFLYETTEWMDSMKRQSEWILMKIYVTNGMDIWQKGERLMAVLFAVFYAQADGQGDLNENEQRMDMNQKCVESTLSRIEWWVAWPHLDYGHID